jgi:hypothetical protein
VLSASANKLMKIMEQAEEYANLIMEELDPENMGYIELRQLKALLQGLSYEKEGHANYSQNLSQQILPVPIRKNPIQRAMQNVRYLLNKNWQRA